MKSSTNKKVIKMVQLALLFALVVVLQVVSAVMPKIGPVSITLTLVPVVVGAIVLGTSGGAVLGFAFGLIVMINCIVGLDAGGSILWNANPWLCGIICFVKGIAAGVAPALIYRVARGKSASVSNARKYASAILAAISAPVVNTALFVAGMFLFFKDTLYAWAGGTNVATYVIVGLAGVNFIVELAINIILSPAIVRIVDVVGKKVKRV